MLRSGKNITVGLEFSGQVLRAVCIEHSQDRPKLVALEQQRYPKNIPEALHIRGDAGRMIRNGNKTRRIVVNIPGISVHLRKIQIETSEANHLDDWVRWEAQQCFPGFPEDYLVEYQKLSSQQADLQDVLLVAARAEDVRQRARIFHSAGLQPAVMDADPLALQNAFETNYPGWHDDPVLLVNIEETTVTAVATRSGLPEGALSLEMSSRQTPRMDDVHRIVEQLKSRIRGEEESRSSAVKMLLSGGSPSLGEMANRFSAEEEMEVEFADPFRELAVLPELRNQLEHRYHASEFMLSTGLALREP
jgi:Tfp pilus assembly PilM family ATPase